MNSTQKEKEVEPEFRGPFWLHPYFLYLILTALLFGAMVLIGWLALENGWIPNRGIG